MSIFNKRYWMLWEEARDKNHKLKRAEFAELMGVTVGQSNGWLDTSTEADCTSLVTIAKRANVNVSWLVGETNIRNFDTPNLFVGLPVKAADELEEFVRYLRFKYKVE